MNREAGGDRKFFVDEQSVVRKIWGNADTIFLIFAGAAAEFAVSKAVDWLYFTGKLPKDPLKRMFSTVSYAQAIVFAEKQAAHRAIDAMSAIHTGVEAKRGSRIPDWAYRDVLFMLIDYSLRAFEILERKLTGEEKKEVFGVFYRLGDRMGIVGLPTGYEEWVTMRADHLKNNLQYSDYSKDLFRQYRKHLGFFRYLILIEAQALIGPEPVRARMGLKRFSFLHPVVAVYKVSRMFRLDRLLKALVLPSAYKKEIAGLDVV